MNAIPNWHYENELAKSFGYACVLDQKRGFKHCRFHADDVHIWKSRHWIRAKLVDKHYRYHTKHETLAEALKGINGASFGPDSRSGKSPIMTTPPERRKNTLEFFYEIFTKAEDFVNASMSHGLFRDAEHAIQWWVKQCK